MHPCIYAIARAIRPCFSLLLLVDWKPFSSCAMLGHIFTLTKWRLQGYVLRKQEQTVKISGKLQAQIVHRFGLAMTRPLDQGQHLGLSW